MRHLGATRESDSGHAQPACGCQGDPWDGVSLQGPWSLASLPLLGPRSPRSRGRSGCGQGRPRPGRGGSGDEYLRSPAATAAPCQECPRNERATSTQVSNWEGEREGDREGERRHFGGRGEDLGGSIPTQVLGASGHREPLKSVQSGAHCLGNLHLWGMVGSSTRQAENYQLGLWVRLRRLWGTGVRSLCTWRFPKNQGFLIAHPGKPPHVPQPAQAEQRRKAG